jgi:hypothetical protein
LQFGENARAEELSVEQMLALCEQFRRRLASGGS